MRSRRVEERSDNILVLWAARKDITLEELRAGLAKMGLTVSVAGLHRFFVRRGMTLQKKTAHAIEQDRPDILKQRHDWFDSQIDLEPERLVFIDES